MVTVNSLDQGLFLELFSSLVEDVADATCCPISEVKRDLTEVRYRCTKEGFSFLTKTLPSLGKALDRALQGLEPFQVPMHFRTGAHSALPELFRWYFRNVFHDSTAQLLQPNGPNDANRRETEVEVASIRALRQILYYLYKLEIPATQETEALCLDSFEQVDHELSEFSIIRSDYVKDCSRFINDVFGTFDHRNITPRHGPGVVATGEESHAKHVFSRLYTAIERVYPFTEYYVYSTAHIADDYNRIQELQVLQAGTTKVKLVPKDSRGPRIISCEPLEYQWIQQGLGRAVMAHLESHRLTAGHVNFTDQAINRRLALEGSADQRWVTLDMKEASDRVGVDLVQKMFWTVQPLLDALLATRSPCSELPSGRVVQLNKFATMGSCLCFPVQAIVFYALAVVAIRREYGVTRREALDSVYVFGDDIIVDARYYPALLQWLPTVGLRFNDGKCCTAGFFRESCGCDAYKGVDVTPLRLKKVWCRPRVSADVIEAYVDHSNMAYARSYKRLANLTGSLVEKQLDATLPVLPKGSQGRGYFALIRDASVFQAGSARVRYNSILHRFEIRAWTSRTPTVRVPSDAWSMVLRRLTSPSDIHEPGVFAVSRGNCLHRGWTAL